MMTELWFVLASSDLIPFLMFGGIFTIIIIAGVAMYYMEKKRTEAFQAVASGLGFSFSPFGTTSLEKEVAGFELFKKGRSPKTKNVLSGLKDDTLLLTMDYQYTVGSGKNAHTYHQTVVLVGSETLDLPKFHLRPEGFFDKIGDVFGFKDIDFQSHPKFSSKYMLKGEQEDKIRAAFNSNALDWFERHLGLCVEAIHDRIIVYRSGQRIQPAEINAAIDAAVEIKNLFAKS